MRSEAAKTSLEDMAVQLRAVLREVARKKQNLQEKVCVKGVKKRSDIDTAISLREHSVGTSWRNDSKRFDKNHRETPNVFDSASELEVADHLQR